jgi:hypothetical protein
MYIHCGERILQRKTQFNVRHLQTQNNAVKILDGQPPQDTTGRQYKLSYQTPPLGGAVLCPIKRSSNRFACAFITFARL